jgi:hypothetical protein
MTNQMQDHQCKKKKIIFVNKIDGEKKMKKSAFLLSTKKENIVWKDTWSTIISHL